LGKGISAPRSIGSDEDTILGRESLVTLQITEGGTPPQKTFYYNIHQDVKVIASNQSLSQTDAEAVRDISRQYGSLFEQRWAPTLSIQIQKQLGKRLFDLWLAAFWDMICVPIGSKRTLIIASNLPDILNLPWEMMLPPDCDFLGIDPLFSIRRLPNAKELTKFEGKLRAGPLRLLFMACAPKDQLSLVLQFQINISIPRSPYQQQSLRPFYPFCTSI